MRGHFCHTRYCLVYLAVAKDEVAPFIRRLLRHREFDTVAKRMGTVVRVSHVDLSVWRLMPSKPSTLLGGRRGREPGARGNHTPGQLCERPSLNSVRLSAGGWRGGDVL